MISIAGNYFLFGAIFILLALSVLWWVAEKYWSRRWRITLGLILMVYNCVLVSLVSIGVTMLQDQSYYAASIKTLLDEVITGLEVGDESVGSRLRAFRESQSLTYETRAGLLENARDFKRNGELNRSNAKTTEQEPGQESGQETRQETRQEPEQKPEQEAGQGSEQEPDQ